MITTTRRPTLPVALAAVTVALQVAYPLLHGRPRDLLTVVTVLAFLACSASHALIAQGPRWTARLFAVIVIVSLVVEALGVRSGLPFGRYTYGSGLGPKLLGVPLVVPLAWAMFAYPAALVGRRLGRPVLGGAAALVSWDLFLDPQMVAEGHWRWSDVQVALPGHVPLSNLVGWALVSLLLMRLVDCWPAEAADETVPVVLFLWTWLGSTLANAAFFDRPLVAVTGGIGMGLVAVPLVRRL